MDAPLWVWVSFNAFVLAMLALDLGVFHRHAHVVKLGEALTWSAVWIALALTFNVGIYYWAGPKPALEFLTGYLIEKSLSVDNLFVFAVLFAAFRVPADCKHKILFWGVFGALLMRAAMIFAGVALIERFHWLVYLFGGFLVLTGLKMLVSHPQQSASENHFVLRLCRRLFRVTSDYHGDRFIVRQKGLLTATPLLLVLILVEVTDLIFAVDSIPAILAVSSDTFIVYTSNVFAMLGLRALFFALAGVMDMFRYLKYGLAAILAFVGTKMLLVDVAPIPIAVSLSVVVGILATSILASLWRVRTESAEGLPMTNLSTESSTDAIVSDLPRKGPE